MPDGPILTLAWMIGTLAVAYVALTYIPAIVIKCMQRQWLARACRGRMVLTFDDGPDPLLTPRLLDLLRRHNAKASFFFLGFRALRSPHICDLVLKSGHEIGCHSHTHENSWRSWPWQPVLNASKAYREMASWMPSDAPFRPPHGKLTTWTWLALKKRGAALCWWTVDGGDTRPNLPDPGHVAQQAVARGGAVVLLHNHDRGLERQEYVLAVTEQILIAARRAGLQISTVGELVQGVEGDLAIRRL